MRIGASQFHLSGGDLPEGLEITQNGLLVGFPTEAQPAPFSFEVTVTDANGQSDVESFQIRVVVLPLVNTSIELLAEMLWHELAPALAGSAVEVLSVAVAETAGQACAYRASLG